LTFSRTGWSETKVIPVTSFPTPASFYQVGGQDVNVYLQPIQYDVNLYGFTWYVNAPAVLTDPANNKLLGGSGPLTITVSGMKFAEASDVAFQPDVTHIYYVGFVNGYYTPLHIPGDQPVSPGAVQYQRTPIRPLDPGDPEFALYGPSYGTPYEDELASDVTFVLPDLFVPSGANWELSFGAGFVPVEDIPEPASILLAIVSMFFIRKRS
jgi:hypothetical protein